MQRFLRHSRSLQREVSRVNSLFYAKMAVSNIRKNKKIFFPYIIMNNGNFLSDDVLHDGFADE